MATSVNITSNGIQKVLRNFNEKQAIAEYLWNGFDANADTIEINFSANELGYISQLEIMDNGYGIDFDSLNTKFNLFYESEKALNTAINKNRSAMHGKNGIGRLTFFRIANDAEWHTTFAQNNILKSGKIGISIASLNTYQYVLLDEPVRKTSGTRVVFSNLKIDAVQLEQEILPYLKSEFSWFFELNKKKGYSILINGTPLDYDDNILDYEEEIQIKYEDTNTSFKLKFVQWKEALHKELSKVYYLSDKKEELYKEYTTLNKKADEYFHSVYIESEFFTEFDFSGTEYDLQTNLYKRSRSSPEFRFLNKQVNSLLLSKRKTFLKDYSGKLLERYQKEGILPQNLDENISVNLSDTLKALYEIQPKLFSNLSIDQKKTFVSLLSGLLVSDQRNRIMTMMEGIVSLDEEEKAVLNKLLLNP